MIRRARPLLGTIVDIMVEGDASASVSAIEAAFASIELVQRLMSFHDPKSDVCRINGAAPGEEVVVDPHTSRVLGFARELSEVSTGLFDVTTASVLVENGLLPEHGRAAGADGATYRDLLLLPGNRVLWRRMGRIDLGGIAKGYAVDCAIAALRSRGVTGAMVNAGGDLRCFGAAQPLHIRHPEAPTTLIQLGSLANAAVATSGGYFSGIDREGRRFEQLVDPRRGACTRWKGSVSVVAPSAMTADALTKVVGLAPARAPALVARFDAQAIVIDNRGVRSCGRLWLCADVAA